MPAAMLFMPSLLGRAGNCEEGQKRDRYNIEYLYRFLRETIGATKAPMRHHRERTH